MAQKKYQPQMRLVFFLGHLGLEPALIEKPLKNKLRQQVVLGFTSRMRTHKLCLCECIEIKKLRKKTEFLKDQGHLGLEPAYDSRTVKKWAAAAGHFRFYHRKTPEQVIPASFERYKKRILFHTESLKHGPSKT